MTLHNFIEMGGYAPYVWSAYGITLSVFLLNIFFSLNEKKKVKKRIKHYLVKQQYS